MKLSFGSDRSAADSGMRLYGWMSLLIALATLIPLLIQDPLLFFDDKPLIEPLRNLSISDYLTNVLHLRIYDVQPVRDLVFMFELKAQEHLSIFHATSLVIGLLVLVTWGVFTQARVFSRSPDSLGSTLALGWVFTHGAWIWSLCWVSSQKHLLSTLFICVFFIQLIKIAKPGAEKARTGLHATIASLCLSLSLLSHPMFVGAGLLPSFFLLQKRDKRWVPLALSCLLITSLVTWVNWYYYGTIYPHQFEAYKFMETSSRISSDTFFQFGRYFFNLIFPTNIAATYWSGSWQALAGIPVGVIFLYLIWKLLDPLTALLFAGAVLAPFFMTAPFQFNIFHSDTYLILPVLACAWLLVNLQKRYPALKWGVIGLIGLNLLGSVSIPASFQNDGDFWARSYENEKSPMNLIGVVTAQLQRKQYAEAKHNLDLLDEWHGEHPRLPTLNCTYAAHAPDLTTDERIVQMRSAFRKSNDSVCAVLLIRTLLREKRTQEAILVALNLQKLNVFLQYRSEALAAAVGKECEAVGIKNCSEIKEHFITLTLKRPVPWNESLYQTSLSQPSSALDAALPSTNR